MRPLVIGEAPSRESGEALHGRAGAFLGAFVGVEQISLVADTANIFPAPVEHWHPGLARYRGEMLLWDQPRSRPLVLCGRRVARAVGAGMFDWFEPGLVDWHPCIVIPHPSGRNRLWNYAWTREAAPRAFRSILMQETHA